MAESKDTTINVDELILCEACFCSHSMLYCDMPGCIGCSTKEECLCCQEQCCLKLGAAPLLCKSEDPDVCFQTGCIVYACACKKPSTCCLYRGQVCCIVEQCAFPCDKVRPWKIRIGLVLATPHDPPYALLRSLGTACTIVCSPRWADFTASHSVADAQTPQSWSFGKRSALFF